MQADLSGMLVGVKDSANTLAQLAQRLNVSARDIADRASQQNSYNFV